MSSVPGWTWHKTYKRNYKDFELNGKYWRRYDDDNGPLVEIPTASLSTVPQSTSQSQSIRQDPTIPRSQQVAAKPSISPPLGTSEIQSYTASESQYFTSNSPPSSQNPYGLLSRDTWQQNQTEEGERDPWGANRPEEANRDPWGANRPEEADRDPWGARRQMSPGSSDFSPLTEQSSVNISQSTAHTELSDTTAQVSPGGVTRTAWTNPSQAPLPQGQGFVSHLPTPYVSGHPETRPTPEASAPQQPLLARDWDVYNTRPILASRQSSGGQNKKYVDQHGRILIPAKSGGRKRVSSTSKPREEQTTEPPAALFNKMLLSDSAPKSEEVLDDESPPSRRPVNEPTMPPLNECEVLDSKYHISSSNDADEERLDDRYKRRPDPGRFFIEGRVFALLWSEPHGANGTDVSQVAMGGIKTRLGEKVYSGIRRMIVVRGKKGCCWCIPVLTYQKRGTSKPGVDAKSHAIVYMSNSKPARLPAETQMTKEPICVEPATPEQKLHQLSRVNFGKIYTVEHNVKVLPVGMVARKSMHHLRGYFRIELE